MPQEYIIAAVMSVAIIAAIMIGTGLSGMVGRRIGSISWMKTNLGVGVYMAAILLPVGPGMAFMAYAMNYPNVVPPVVTCVCMTLGVCIETALLGGYAPFCRVTGQWDKTDPNRPYR